MGLKEIERGAFMYCKRLKRVVLNEGLTTLRKDDVECEFDGKYCYGVFWYSGLEEITIPSTLERIGYCTFEGCENLKTVWVADGCVPDIKRCVRDPAVVLPEPQRIVGN